MKISSEGLSIQRKHFAFYCSLASARLVSHKRCALSSTLSECLFSDFVNTLSGSLHSIPHNPNCVNFYTTGGTFGIYE